MEVNIWSVFVIPLFTAILSGTIQLYLEYFVIQPSLRHKNDGSLPIPNAEAEQKRIGNVNSPVFLSITRVLTIFILTFGSVSVAATIGYELKGAVGIAYGTLIALILTVIAMWAVKQWSEQIAKIASYFALAAIIALFFTGCLTLTGRLVGFPIDFSSGFFVVVLVIVALVMFVVMIVLGIVGLFFSNNSR